MVLKKQQHVTVKKKNKKKNTLVTVGLSHPCLCSRLVTHNNTQARSIYIFLYSPSAIFCPSPPDSDEKGNTTNFDPCVHFAGDYKFSGVDVSYIISGTLTFALCCVGFIAVAVM